MYIHKCVEYLGLSDLKPLSTPIDKPIDPDSPKLHSSYTKIYMTAIGMLGWLSISARPDVTYAYSKISQHQSKPTEAAWDAIVHCFRYLIGTANDRLYQTA